MRADRPTTRKNRDGAEEKRGAERRQIRVPVLFWEIRDGKPHGRGEEIVTHDLSGAGLSFESPQLYAIRSTRLGQLHLPGHGDPLIARLAVTRIETLVGREGYRIGMTFEAIAEADRATILACLEKMNLYRLLQQAAGLGASDLHLTVGREPLVRLQGEIGFLEAQPIVEGQIQAMLYPLLTYAQIDTLERERELDFAFSPDVHSRFRVNLHYQSGFLEATLRSVPTRTRSLAELNLPAEVLQGFCREKAGLILIAGATGSGKTTTMASMVDYINATQQRVVITVEDPIEFKHVGRKSVIKQRELGQDTLSYAEALKRSLRQDPDVIVVGELIDSDCVMAALRAAETGHLVISTVHAPDTVSALERVVNLFPPEHAAGICQTLASTLVGVLFQTLVSARDQTRVLATELLISNFAVKNLLREKKFSQLPSVIQTGGGQGMYPLKSSLQELSQRGLIDAGSPPAARSR